MDLNEAREDTLRVSALCTLLLVVAAAVAAAPIWLHRSSCGDDLQFHMVSWFDAQQSWRAGHAYPHWTASANFGAGEPRFIFYPPLTWMLGAALGLVLPWAWVSVVLSFALLCGTGLATRALAARLLTGIPATLAGLAAMVCVYPLYTAYNRAAFGELTGGFWIPLLYLFALEDRRTQASMQRRAFDGSAVPLALVVAGCWLSDAPVGVMAIYLLGAVAVTAAVLARSWFPVARAAVAGTLGLGLAAIYILPAAWEQSWVNVLKATGVGDPGLSIENNWLFGHSSDPSLQAHLAGLHFVSWLAVAMLTVTAASMAGILLHRGRTASRARRIWMVLACVPAAVLLLQLPLSLPLWNLLPRLRFLQFPWRWLLVLEAPMGLFLAAAVWPAQRWKRVVGITVFSGVLLGSLFYANAAFFMRACPTAEVPGNLVAQLQSGAGSWGTDEYEPIGTDITLIPAGLPDACFTDAADAELATESSTDANPVWSAGQQTCLPAAQAAVRVPDHLRVSASGMRAGYAVLRLQSYPAWRVRVNGVKVRDWKWREDGLIAVPVPAGAADVSVDWVTTWDVVVGRVVSLFSVVVLVWLGWWERARPNRSAN